MVPRNLLLGMRLEPVRAGWPESEHTSVRLTHSTSRTRSDRRAHLRPLAPPWEVLPTTAPSVSTCAPHDPAALPDDRLRGHGEGDRLALRGVRARREGAEVRDGRRDDRARRAPDRRRGRHLATPNREYQSPKTHRESCEAAARWLDNPWVIDGVLVEVDDLEAHHARAVKAGANVIRAPRKGRAGVSTPPRTSRVTAGCSSSADDSRRVLLTSASRPMARRWSCNARWPARFRRMRSLRR